MEKMRAPVLVYLNPKEPKQTLDIHNKPLEREPALEEILRVPALVTFFPMTTHEKGTKGHHWGPLQETAWMRFLWIQPCGILKEY